MVFSVSGLESICTSGLQASGCELPKRTPWEEGWMFRRPKQKILKLIRRIVGTAQVEERLTEKIHDLSRRVGKIDASERILFDINHKISLLSDRTDDVWSIAQEMNHRSIVLEQVSQRLSMWDDMNHVLTDTDAKLNQALKIAVESARSAAIDADSAMTLVMALLRKIDEVRTTQTS
jgi:hypothetical protein